MPTIKKSFGGFGAGGSFVMVDPVNNLTMVYTMNKMSPKIKNEPRAVKLCNCVYKSLKSSQEYHQEKSGDGEITVQEPNKM